MEARRGTKSAAELAARNSYGRLVAYLAVRSQDVAVAEDALGDAFLAALKTWPTSGVGPIVIGRQDRHAGGDGTAAAD